MHNNGYSFEITSLKNRNRKNKKVFGKFPLRRRRVSTGIPGKEIVKKSVYNFFHSFVEFECCNLYSRDSQKIKWNKTATMVRCSKLIHAIDNFQFWSSENNALSNFHKLRTWWQPSHWLCSQLQKDVVSRHTEVHTIHCNATFIFFK